MRYVSSRIGLSLKSNTQQGLTSRLERLEKRERISDSKLLAAYEGNLIIEMVKRLSENYDIESGIRGNDPEASKRNLLEQQKRSSKSLVRRRKSMGALQKMRARSITSGKELRDSCQNTHRR